MLRNSSRKKWATIRCLILGLGAGLLLWMSPAYAQSSPPSDEEALLALFRAGNLDALRTEAVKTPENSGAGKFLRGLFERDGEKARYHYDQVVALYQDSAFRPWALQRLWQQHWAKGEKDMAQRFLDILSRRYPGHPALNIAPDYSHAGDLKEVAQQPIPISQSPHKEEPRPYWTIQLGAFRNPAGAREVGEQAQSWGEVRYLTKRVENLDLTVVQVGRFVDRQEAEEFLSRLKKASGLAGRVVPGEGDNR